MRRYKLAPYTRDSKITCPACGKPKVFRRFIDLRTGDYCPDHVGMCDRVQHCGYKLMAWDWAKEKGEKKLTIAKKDVHESVAIRDTENYDTISKDTLFETLEGEYQDDLSIFLLKYFHQYETRVREVLNDYKVGSVRLWGRNCTVFWQISTTDIRTGKIMAYEEKDRDIHRVKFDVPDDDEPDKMKTIHLMSWYHSRYLEEDFNFRQCFFGEHLIAKYPEKRIHIVESEKTALLCAIAYPQYLWLSCGTVNGLNEEKMGALHGRKIVLYPDRGSIEPDKYTQWKKDNHGMIKAYNEWLRKAEEFSKIGYDIEVTNFVEKRMSDFPEGSDMGDLIIREFVQKVTLP